MALPNSGPISLSQIQTEFGGTNPISLSEYYAGGSNVSGGTSGTNGAVPSSGTIGMNKFYGTSSGPVARGIVVLPDFSVTNHVLIATTGNATLFGDIGLDSYESGGSVGSSTRAIFTTFGNILYTTFAATGTGTLFGNMSTQGSDMGSVNNATRGVFIAGEDFSDDDSFDLMSYITIATLGNDLFFGTLSSGQNYYVCNGNINSTTRGLCAGGIFSHTQHQYITIATLGNSTSFGSLSGGGRDLFAGTCSNTRAVYAGGRDFGAAGAATASSEYVTIATTGATTNFGNLTSAKNYLTGISSLLRGVYCGGYIGGSTPTAVMDYITIASAGAGTNFGNLTVASTQNFGTSNAHGGL